MTYHSDDEKTLLEWCKSNKVKLSTLAAIYGLKKPKYLRQPDVWRSGERPRAIIALLRASGAKI